MHDMPGTTRDAIDTVVETPDGPVRFIDTAGLRRPSRTDRGTEQHATLRALRALERADIAVLVIDATIGASHQDQRLAERIGVSGCPAIVVLNKWDLVAVDDRDDVLAGVGDRLAFLGAAPVLKISAQSGKGVHRILPALRDSVEAYHQRVPTGALNRTVQELQLRQAAPRSKIRYIVQGAIDPPTFTLFTNGRLPQTYLRYIERGTPGEIRLRRDADEAAGADRREVERPVRWPGARSATRSSRTRTWARRGSARPAARSWPIRSASPIPWYFKFMLVATVIYLGYRGYQGVTWIAAHV